MPGRMPYLLGALFFGVIAVSALAAQAPSAGRFAVVVDAAHGGDDAGAKLGSQAEKAYTLALGGRLRSLLAARGMQVVTTRDADAAVDATRRAEIANHANAQACLSLHAAQTGSGVHLFISSLSSATAANLPAWKTVQSSWTTRSLTLAGMINSALTKAGIAVTLGRTALPGLDSMACPAVAIEVAPEKGAKAQGAAAFDNPDYQARVAKALAAALVQWRAEGQEAR
jgi:N-acetylmuramoyl-L-alanine amidase